MTVNDRLRAFLTDESGKSRAPHSPQPGSFARRRKADADPESGRRALARSRTEELRRELDALIEAEGPWTAHDICLAPGVQTLNSRTDDARLRRVVQVAADLSGKPISKLRVLDLGSLEGQFALEFALHGAEVVAVEGRETNLRKASFAARALGAKKLDLRAADVRELKAGEYGRFDVVLCLGILYHLDSPDVMALVHSMAKLCRGLVIIDSHFSPKAHVSVDWDGHRYSGDFWTEYQHGARVEEEERALWSSIGNDRSFLLTRPSLCNLLRHAGFTSVYECLNPYECHSPDWPLESRSGDHVEWPDRSTFIAVKGRREKLITSPITDKAPERDRPESPKYLQPIRPTGSRFMRSIRRLLSAAVPRGVRRS